MRNLFAFIWKNHFFFLFLFLEIMALSLVVRNNYYQNAVFVSSTNQITGSFMKTYDNVIQYFSLRLANEKLAEENARLQSGLSRSFLIGDTKVYQINDTVYKQEYQYLNAKVIKNTVHKRNNYLMLDKGLNDGVKRDMGVISSNGIVGIVIEVSENFSTVLSILHKKTNISVMLKKNNQKGTLTWDGNKYTIGTVTDIPTHVMVEKGDTVITSGNSALFPEGIMVGTVENYEIDKGVNLYDIKIRFSVDFNNISYAYIVNNLFKDEQEQLEKLTENE
ncbi:MAG: rod shape-determining protein MreC [Saprospiraceae bacterium]|nr:rod shape-determining protein MreC [Saprospiraceae bacterium]